MKVGIAGMPLSGKTTVFRALTHLDEGAQSGSKGKPAWGIVDLPDLRLDRLSIIYKPKKVVPFRVHVYDIPGPGSGGGEGDLKSLPPKFIADMRTMDVLCGVIDGFSKPDGGEGLLKQMNKFREEIFVADYSVLEKKFERFNKGEKEGFAGEKEILKKIKDAIESYEDISSLNLSPEILKMISGYAFLTVKPVIYVLNISENNPPVRDAIDKVNEEAKKLGAGLVTLFGKLEVELLSFEESERKEFFMDVGLQESGVKNLLSAIKGSLNLITFYTTANEELRAWGISQGTRVVEAAGKIHTDMEKGFIKAEVVSYDDISLLGSELACRKEGKLRQEGKNYIVKDGDIITIKFNV